MLALLLESSELLSRRSNDHGRVSAASDRATARGRYQSMYTAMLALHILVSLGLIVTVLLQSGKGGGLAGAFGGGGGVGAVFGGQTAASFLTKATRYLAVIFMVSSLSMALIVRTRTPGTVEEGLRGMQPAPAAATGEPIPQQFEGGLPGSDEAGTEAQPSGEQIPIAQDGSDE